MSKRITIQAPTDKGPFIDLEGRVVVAHLGGESIRLLLADNDDISDIESGFSLGNVGWVRVMGYRSYGRYTDKTVVQMYMDKTVKRLGLEYVKDKLEWARAKTKRLLEKQNG